MQLLFRFYDVDSGGVSVDESDIRDVTMRSLRSQIGVVPQNSVLFNASVRYNLLYANPEASVDEVQEACQAAHIHERILSFPDGYDTVVGEGGSRLSGGEKQRVSRSNSYQSAGRFIFCSITDNTTVQDHYSTRNSKKAADHAFG